MRRSCAIARSSASARGSRRTSFSASLTLPSAVMCGHRLNCWNTMPIPARTARSRAAGTRVRRPAASSVKPSGSPNTSITPESASSRNARQRSSVLLPEPEGPITQVAAPAGISRSILCRTSVAPNDLLRCSDGDGGAHQANRKRASLRSASRPSQAAISTRPQ